MGPMTAQFTVDQNTVAAPAKRSIARICVDAITDLANAIRHQASNRRLRDQLAEMDDALLKDIGIADDELHMIRARRQFTPRAWATSRGNGGGWTA